MIAPHATRGVGYLHRVMRATIMAVAVTLVGCKRSHPPPYKIEGWPDADYELTPIDDANVRFSYATPCGKAGFDIEVAYAILRTDDRITWLGFPADTTEPIGTEVRVDPKLTGSAKIGAVALARDAATTVYDLACGAPLWLDGRASALPPRPRDGNLHALFVTARAEQCFLDEVVVYGIASNPAVAAGWGTGTRLEGAHAYWLRSDRYTYWFRAPDAKIVEYGVPTLETGRMRLAECPAEP